MTAKRIFLHAVQLENSTQKIRAHKRRDCKGKGRDKYCPIHKRSDHPMRMFPQHWRDDRKIMERICPHGIGHPDPDDPNKDPIHGCDGCCSLTHMELVAKLQGEGILEDFLNDIAKKVVNPKRITQVTNCPTCGAKIKRQVKGTINAASEV